MIERDPLPEDAALFPCSQSQLRFWIEEQLAPRNPALNVAVRWRLEGTVDPGVLEDAWRRLIARHAALRTAIVDVDGEPMQRVAAHPAFSVPVVDLRDWDETEGVAEAERLAAHEARNPFDLACPPLVRVTAIRLTDVQTVVLVTAHHAICDGWSIGILAREMGQICAALAAGAAPFLPDLPHSYAEIATREHAQLASAEFADVRSRVAKMLRGCRQFELLPDFPRPPRLTANGAIASVLLDRSLTAALAELARANGCTLFMTVLAAIFTLLHRYSGERDIVIGTQVAGRDDEEIEALVGCFVNTIALRGDLSGDPDFLTLMERTQDMVSDAFDMRALPLQQLVQIANPVRDPSRNALFSVNVIYQRSFIANERYGEFALVDLPSRSAGAMFDLNLFMVERPEGWRFSCEYNIDLFAPSTIAGLLASFVTLLESVVADPSRSIGRIPILDDARRAALTVAANDTATAYPAGLTLLDLVTHQVRRDPAAIALVCGDARLTYGQLGAAVDRLARRIVERVDYVHGMHVAVVLDRSLDMVVALLAAMRAGCAYVPLDPAYPAERLAFIANDAAIALTLTRTTLAQRTGAPASCCLFVDDEDLLAESALDGAPPAVTIAPDDIAYTIYTSGSTGKPKGVRIPHRALANFVQAMRDRPGISQRDTLVAVTTIAFDIAALELFVPLASGATVVLAAENQTRDGAELLHLIRQSRATIVQATPVTWQLLIAAGWQGDPRIRMLCGGEPLARALAHQLLDRGPELWNMYGPTETTIWSSALRVERGDGPVLIGPPIANTRFYVLDAGGELVPDGVAGELTIAGDGVAAGYLDRPDLTAERFVPDPFTQRAGATMYRTGDLVRRRAAGCFEFLGRNDHQVKVRGYRIELGEITAALLAVPGVADAIAIADDDSDGATAVRAFIVAQPERDANTAWIDAVRAAIAEFLPAYMVPASIVALDHFPRLPNGKVDRHALAAIAVTPADREPARAPLTPTEAAVALVAAELLNRDSVERDDDLFERGFHSLLCVRLVARLAQTFGVRIALRAVFDEPTVAGIARAVCAAQAAASPAAIPAPQPVVAYNAGGSEPGMIFFHSDAVTEGMYCRRLAAAIGARRPLIAVAPHGSAGLPVVPTIEAMARDFIERIKAFQPAGPYRVGGHCIGGIVAFEVARQLRAAGEVVDDVVIVNAFAPLRARLPAADRLLRRFGTDASLDPIWREKFCLNVARVAESIDRGSAAALRFVRDRFTTLFRLRERAVENRINAPEIAQHTRGTPATEAYFAYIVAGFTYHPAPYDGTITVVLTEGEGDSLGDPNRDDPTIGWAKHARRIALVPMEGDHNSPIRENVDELGAIIAARGRRR